MAYPVVENTFTGVETLNALHHEITLPSGITAGDLIAIFVSVIGESEIDNGYGTGCGINIVDYVSSNNWNVIRGGIAGVTNNNINLLYAIAYDSPYNYVTVRSQTWWRNSSYSTYWNVLAPCMISYVGFIISGHGITSGYNSTFKHSSTSGNISNWITNACPTIDDLVTDDYLWLLGVCATDNDIATASPTGFSTIITAQGSNVATATSTSACYRQYNTVSQYPQTSFSAPPSIYDSLLIRIPSGSGTNTYSGFGIFVHRNSINL